jgi:nicotinamidase/pyrazinamidase
MESGPFGRCVATQGWHPPGHISFASAHTGARAFDVIDRYGHPQTLWPNHCVQDTPGAALHEALPWERVAAIVRKAMDLAVDSYSAFRNNWDRAGERPLTGLGGYLRERRTENAFICGVARDFCVKYTAEDAVLAGFRTHVLWNLTRAVDPSFDEGVRSGLVEQGVRILESAGVDRL